MTERSDTQTRRIRCAALKRNGQPCRAWAVLGSDPPLCVRHQQVEVAVVPENSSRTQPRPRRCSTTASTGRPCLGWAVHGSDPPLCPAHGGGRLPSGAPTGNQNALVHGMYARTDKMAQSIDEIITDLAQKQAFLTLLIEDALNGAAPDISPDRLVRIFAIHGQNSARLGRLLRDRRALTGDAADGFSAAVAQALDELSTELGTQL